MPIYKRCSRCGKRLHANETCSCLKNRHKEYRKYRTDTKEETFYASQQYQKVKNILKEKYKRLDIYEYYINHRIVVGYTMHHIVEIKDDWSRRLDMDNLIYLTESNHQMVHKAYKSGATEKKQMQDLLYSLIIRWSNDFGCQGVT